MSEQWRVSYSALDCAEMWNLWHGSKLEQYISRNRSEKQPLLNTSEGKLQQQLAQYSKRFFNSLFRQLHKHIQVS